METSQRRKLAVILHADIVDSTTMVRRDEALAHDRIQDAFRRLSEQIKAYGGRTHELRGDALVGQFDRGSDAVCAALSFQASNAQVNAGLDNDVCPVLRVGISIGEVVIADGTVTGGGVVLAQRLEQLAEPGGVCIQGAVYETLPQKLPLDYTPLGDQIVKGFDEPVRAYAVGLKSGQSLPGSERPTTLKVAWVAAALTTLLVVAVGLIWQQPWKVREQSMSVAPTEHPVSEPPSIAVLPFTNMSNDPEQEYFSDGISEDIITDLSQISGLGVIARNSSFAYKGTAVNVQEVGKDLGVGYILEGSVRKAGDRLRITAQLVDTEDGHHLWAERYDRFLTDIFELQDEIRNSIVSALAVQLIGDESKNLAKHSTNSFEAYDLFLQGRRLYNEYTAESLERAIGYYRQAIEMDPEFARAYGALGIALSRRTQTDDANVAREERLKEALDMAERAVEIDPDSPQTQWALGFVRMFRQEFEKAANAVERAVSLSPNYADGWGLLALINNQVGRGDQALRFIRKGMALNPRYSWDYPYNEGRAFHNMGEYEKAIEPLLLALERNENAWNPRLFLTSSYVRLDRIDDAEWEITQLEVQNPNLSIPYLQEVLPMSEGDHKDRFYEDMRRAGVPEE